MGPAGIEPTTSTVEAQQFDDKLATITSITDARGFRSVAQKENADVVA